MTRATRYASSLVCQEGHGTQPRRGDGRLRSVPVMQLAPPMHEGSRRGGAEQNDGWAAFFSSLVTKLRLKPPSRTELRRSERIFVTRRPFGPQLRQLLKPKTCLNCTDIGFRKCLGPLLSAALLLAGCDMSIGHLTGRATDEWTHRYPLSSGGEIRIVNTNGKLEVEPPAGPEVQILPERIARAAPEPGAPDRRPR